MKFDYAALAEELAPVLEEFGLTMTLKFPSSGSTYDPITDTYSGGAPGASVQFLGVLVSPTEEYAASVPEGMVVAADMLVYGQPTTPEPTLAGTITITNSLGINEDWYIVNVQPVAPAAIPVLNIIQVRR